MYLAKGNKHKVLTRTPRKTIIQHGELVRILNETEIAQWHHILDKIRRFDEKEEHRLKIYDTVEEE